jgi:hypothetical protein
MTRRSVDQFVLVSGSPLGPMTRFYPYPFFGDNFFVVLPVWSVSSIAAYNTYCCMKEVGLVGACRVRFPELPDFLRSSGSGTGSTQPRECNWEGTWKKMYRFLSRNPRIRQYGSVVLTTQHPLSEKKLALTSPTSGGRSIGIVRSRTKATEFVFYEPPPPITLYHFSRKVSDLSRKVVGHLVCNGTWNVDYIQVYWVYNSVTMQ